MGLVDQDLGKPHPVGPQAQILPCHLGGGEASLLANPAWPKPGSRCLTQQCWQSEAGRAGRAEDGLPLHLQLHGQHAWKGWSDRAGWQARAGVRVRAEGMQADAPTDLVNTRKRPCLQLLVPDKSLTLVFALGRVSC